VRGLEIKPGVWINTDHVVEVRTAYNKEEFDRVWAETGKAKWDAKRFLETVKSAGYDNQVDFEFAVREAEEAVQKLYEKQQGMRMKDYYHVKVSVTGGGYYFVDWSLEETLVKLGWKSNGLTQTRPMGG
jgi:hypothetical protein